MNIYKLRFENKQQGIDFFATENLAELVEGNLQNKEGVQAIVDLGNMVTTQGEWDNEGNVIKETVYDIAYSFDIMCEQEIVSDKIINPATPRHSFYVTAEPIQEELEKTTVSEPSPNRERR